MALTHTIRMFVDQRVKSIVPSASVIFDGVTGDTARATVETKKAKYQFLVSSSYSKPPLGEVIFRDLENSREIVDINQDHTWHKIEQYIQAKEAGRPLEPEMAQISAAPVEPAPTVPVEQPALPLVRFIAPKGDWFHDGPALVTRVNADGSYNLTVFCDNNEPMFRQNVRKQSDALPYCCWAPYVHADTSEQPPKVTKALNNLADALRKVSGQYLDLVERIEALEAKRGPGRPPKERAA